MKHATAAAKCTVVNGDVAAAQTIIGNDDVVSDGAVVAEMRPDHQKILVPNHGGTAFGAAAMDRAVFAKDVVVSDLNGCFPLGRERQILWSRSDDATRSDKVPAADRDGSFKHGVRLDDSSSPNGDVRTDHHVRSDFRVGCYLRPRIDDCGWMNVHSTPASLKLK